MVTLLHLISGICFIAGLIFIAIAGYQFYAGDAGQAMTSGGYFFGSMIVGMIFHYLLPYQER